MKFKGGIIGVFFFIVLIGVVLAVVPSSVNEIDSFSRPLHSLERDPSYVRYTGSNGFYDGKVVSTGKNDSPGFSDGWREGVSTDYENSFSREEFLPGSYIIQLKSPSIIEKQSILEKEKEKKLEESIRTSGKTRGDSSFQILSNKIDDEIDKTIEEYSEEISTEQNNVLLEIENEIIGIDSGESVGGVKKIINFFSLSLTGKAVFSPQSSIKPSSTYQTVLNGFVLENLTSEQASAIENLDSVKNVYPNRIVHATLMDSVPLIQDGVLAGQLDEDGNDCTVSGKKCLTGEGVKIAIIDTGVDYTHPDLGGSIELLENHLMKITSEPISLLWEDSNTYTIDQRIVAHNNKLFYIDGTSIYVYDFQENSTTNVLDSDFDIFKLDVEGDILAYANTHGIYYFNISDNINYEIELVGERSYIGSLYVEGNRIVYGISYFSESQIKIYDTKTSSLKNISVESASSQVQPRVFEDLLAYSVSSGNCYDKVVLYNISSESFSEVSPPDIGRIMDFKNNELLYADCSKTNFDRSRTDYHIYNLDTEVSTPLSTTLLNKDSNAAAIGGVVGTISKGAITSDYIYMSKDVFGDRIVIYDRNLDRYSQINLYKNSGALSVEGSRVCFVSSDNNIYCHNYDPSYDYPVPEPVFNSKVIGGYDFVNDDNDPFDDNGHGTHCAATAAGNGTLNGVAPGAEILAYKVLDRYGSGYWDQVIAGIEQAVVDGADVLSLSLGSWGNSDDAQSQAVDNAVLAGRLLS